jgi:hypothetical protein
VIRICWCLAVNLFEHAKVNVGFRLAERTDRRVLLGDDLIEAVRKATR